MQRSKIIKILTVITAVAAILSAFMISTSAAEQTEPSISYFPEETDTAETLYIKLGDLQNGYVLHSNAGRRASTYMNEYRNYLADHMSADIDTAKLYYYRGVVAGMIGYICHLYTGVNGEGAIAPFDTDTEAAAVVDAQRQAMLEALKTPTTYGELLELTQESYNRGGLIATMYVKVYEFRLAALVDENDSAAAKKLVTDAVTRVQNCSVPYEEAEHLEIYNTAREQVAIQKMQDLAMAELTSSFFLIHPDKNIEDYPKVTAALRAIDLDTGESDTPQKINDHMSAALVSLLDPMMPYEGYTFEYVKGLMQDVNSLISNADEAGRVALPSTLLQDFDLDHARMQTKDRINEYLSSLPYFSGDDEILKGTVEPLYNASNGVLDGAESKAEFAVHEKNACLIGKLYCDSLDAAAEILRYLPEDTEYTAQAKGVFDDNFNKLFGSVEAEASQSIYDMAAAELWGIVDLAEADRFELDHAEILAKPTESISKTDRDAINAAIDAAIALGDGAVAHLQETKTFDSLAAKYRESIKDEIDGMIGTAEGVRADHNAALDARLDALTVSDAPENYDKFRADTADILARASELAPLLDRYDTLCGEEYYPNFFEADKKALAELAELYADRIVSDASYATLADEGIYKLDHKEAESRIRAEAEREGLDDEAKAALEPIVKNALEKIAPLTSTAEIRAETDAALYEIGKVTALSDVRAEIKAAEESVNALAFIPVVKKETALAELTLAYSEARAAVAAAKTAAETADAKSSAFERIESIKNAALTDDLAAAEEKRATLSAKADSKMTELFEKIDSMPYLSEDEKDMLKYEANTAKKTFDEALAAAKTPAETDAAYSVFENELANVSTSTTAQNTSASETKKTDSKTEIRGVFSELEEKLEDLKYLTQTEKNSMITWAQIAMQTFEGELAVANDLTKLISAGTKAAEKLDALYEEAYEKNLSAAKAAAEAALSQEERELLRTVDKLIYLDRGTKGAQRSALSELVSSALSAMGAADTPEEVEEIRDRTLRAAKDIETRTKKLDDEACVRILTPVMIILSCIGVTEAVAIAVLAYIGRKKGLLALAPVSSVLSGFALTPTTAWTITAVLAVIDLAGLIYIIYLAAKLIGDAVRRKRALREEEREREAERLRAEERRRQKEEKLEAERRAEEERRRAAELEAERARIEEKKRLEAEQQTIVITVDEAESLMTDDEALEREAEFSEGYNDTEVYRGKKKAEVNIDTIGKSFEAGETVTLNSLKEKKLVPAQAGYVKVLARGALDKPLTVVAQSFSVAAVKMILLTGGEAIVTYQSSDREDK